MEDTPLLPFYRGNPPLTIPKTPYVCHHRYDAGPFLSYPARVGQETAGAAYTDPIAHFRSESMHPTPIRDQESFVQTWLCFGIVSELHRMNSKDDPSDLDGIEVPQETIDQIYDTMLVPSGVGFNINIDEEKLEELFEVTLSKPPRDREVLIKRCEHIFTCLVHGYAVLLRLPEDFNNAIKYSVAGLCEIIEQAAGGPLSRLGVEHTFARQWAAGYIDEQAKGSMMEHGWCPSDIAMAESKFTSIQAMKVVRMVDKSLPARDHSRCTETSCYTYQIDMEKYDIHHEQPECCCEELVIRPQDLEEILFREDRIPLIRLTGDLHDLKAELVESSANTSYIAISHVWADGLGNPHANSLSRCKLARLREVVSSMGNQGSSDPDPPLIWLDTLCCPAKDGRGKQKAIEKIGLVYQLAAHVLVLDAGIMSYESKPQGTHEKAVRIFTSSWMRRLWTLQEGALAQSLYFQFADKAISLTALRESLFKNENSLRHQTFALDTINEFWRIDAFFKHHSYKMPDGPNIATLDQALQFREVSVSSDEPLCIGGLMSLHLPAILEVEPKGDRMQKVWELLAVKKGGIPALVIFSPEPKIEALGWRWAPKSLLPTSDPILSRRTAIWETSQLGIVDRLGLRVQYPGFRIEAKKYRGEKPRNSWFAWDRVLETYLRFRDSETGKWYMIVDREYHNQSLKQTEEEKKDYNESEHCLLHNTANSNRAVIIMSGMPTHTAGEQGILATSISEDEIKDERRDRDGIAVQTQRYIMIVQLPPEEAYIYDTIREIATRLRNDEWTIKHLDLCELFIAENGDPPEALDAKMDEDEKFNASMGALGDKLKAAVDEVKKRDRRFVDAVNTYFTSDLVESVWGLAWDWFYRDFVGTKIESEQVWYVD